MIDIVDKLTRSRIMANIKSRNTRPELLVRRFLHAAGFRYRLHRKDLPGHPDIVMAKYNLVIFVNGCFWHRHESCFYATSPSTNEEKWKNKLEGNRIRDIRQKKELLDRGWRVLTIWECGLKHSHADMTAIINIICSDARFSEWPSVPPRIRR